MRVVAGAHGGRRLRVPPGRGTRPTPERVREAVFSTLGDTVEGAVVLDLFAGTGALGIEALSRGAASATFVERNRRVIPLLRTNLSTLGLDAEVHAITVERFVDRAAARGCTTPFDLVVCDPPYDLPTAVLSTMLDRLAAAGCLRDGATVVAERARRSDAEPPRAEGFTPTARRTYGDTVVHYLRWNPGAITEVGDRPGAGRGPGAADPPGGEEAT